MRCSSFRGPACAAAASCLLCGALLPRRLTCSRAYHRCLVSMADPPPKSVAPVRPLRVPHHPNPILPIAPQVGDKVEARVLEVDASSRKLLLTLRKGLLAAKARPLASLQQAAAGAKFPGIITGETMMKRAGWGGEGEEGRGRGEGRGGMVGRGQGRARECIAARHRRRSGSCTGCLLADMRCTSAVPPHSCVCVPGLRLAPMPGPPLRSCAPSTSSYSPPPARARQAWTTSWAPLLASSAACLALSPPRSWAWRRASCPSRPSRPARCAGGGAAPGRRSGSGWRLQSPALRPLRRRPAALTLLVCAWLLRTAVARPYSSPRNQHAPG